MKKIFISHSSKDKEIVENLMVFLTAGMGVEKSQIYCTSMNLLPSPGINFMEEIRKELRNAAAYIIILTEHYQKSPMCQMEQGISWYLSGEEGRLLYLMRAGFTIEQMRTMPLCDNQSYSLFDKEGLYALYDGLCRQGIAHQDTEAFLKNVSIFLEKVKATNVISPISGANSPMSYNDSSVQSTGSSTQAVVPVSEANAPTPGTIQADFKGFYTVRIRKVRNVPKKYRCYLIDGLVDIPGTPEAPDETHWLFYLEGTFPDLREGDLVRFTFEKTRLCDFPDLRCARDIFPTRLEVLKE